MELTKNKKRILVYRLGSLGDTIIVLPAFYLIRKAYPDASITLLSNVPINSKAPAMHNILANTGLYNDYISYPSGTRDWRKLLYLAKEIRAGNFDEFIYLAKPKGGWGNVLRDYLFFLLVIGNKITGLPWKKRNRTCVQLNENLYEWDCERTMRCLEELGTVDITQDKFWDLKLTSDELDEANELLASLNDKPFLALSIGTKVKSNDWEEDNWNSLISRLHLKFSQYSMVFIGAPDEKERSDEMMKMIGEKGLNLCGKTTPRVAAAILKKAALFIGHDSGPMHLAASVGTKVVAIYAARNLPGQWYPRGGNEKNTIHYNKTDCFGCGLEVCVEEKKKCILGITVDEVYTSVVRLFE